mgnify:CR=1 FL=1
MQCLAHRPGSHLAGLFWMSEHILVTGATGFLGGTLARQLGGGVIGTGRDPAKLDALHVPSKFACDLSKPLAPSTISHCSNVSTIIHCASLSSPWGTRQAFHDANVAATETVIALTKAVNAKHLIFISSPSVYFQFTDQFDVREDSKLPIPVNNYAATKTAAEERLKASGIPFTILRPRGLYGAGDTTLLPRLLRAARSGPMPLFRNGEVRTDITHVDDVVAAIMAVIEQRDTAFGQTFNISGGVALPIKEVVEKVCDSQGANLRWRPLPVRPALAAVRLIEKFARLRPGKPEPKVTSYGLGIFAFSQTLDLSKINDKIGWFPQVSFEDGLARTFAQKDAA